MNNVIKICFIFMINTCLINGAHSRPHTSPVAPGTSAYGHSTPPGFNGKASSESLPGHSLLPGASSGTKPGIGSNINPRRGR